MWLSCHLMASKTPQVHPGCGSLLTKMLCNALRTWADAKSMMLIFYHAMQGNLTVLIEDTTLYVHCIVHL